MTPCSIPCSMLRNARAVVRPLLFPQGVANVAKVSKELGVRRVVLVSSMLVTKKNWWVVRVGRRAGEPG